MVDKKKDNLTSAGIGLGAGGIGGTLTYAGANQYGRKKLYEKSKNIIKDVGATRASYRKASDRANAINNAIGNFEQSIGKHPIHEQKVLRQTFDNQIDISHKDLANKYKIYQDAISTKDNLRKNIGKSIKNIPKKALVAAAIVGTALGGGAFAGMANHFKKIREEN